MVEGITLNPGASMILSGGFLVLNGLQCGFSLIPTSFNSARLYPDPTYMHGYEGQSS